MMCLLDNDALDEMVSQHYQVLVVEMRIKEVVWNIRSSSRCTIDPSE